MNKELQCCDNPNHKKLFNICHKIFGETALKECSNCNTKLFLPTLDQEEFEKIYCKTYAKNFNLHKVSFKGRKYFIDYSRFELIRKFIYLGDVNNILEIGSGYPGLYPFFKNNNQKYSICEINERTIDIFKELNVPNLDLNFINEKFDLIVCNNVIYYFIDIYSYLKNLRKLLKHTSKDRERSGGGILFIDILNSNTLNEDYYPRTDQINIYSKKSIEFILKKSGFKILFSGNCSAYPPEELHFQNNNLYEKILHRLGLITYSQLKNILSIDKSCMYSNPNGAYLHVIAEYENM